MEENYALRGFTFERVASARRMAPVCAAASGPPYVILPKT